MFISDMNEDVIAQHVLTVDAGYL